MQGDTIIFYLKGCLGVRWGGSPTSILTPYLKSARLFTPSVKFSSNYVQILQRYYDIQGQSNVGMENLNLGILSCLMTSLCHQVRGIPEIQAFCTYFAACLYAVISMQLTEYDENFIAGLTIPADFKYDVRIDVQDPPNQTTFKPFVICDKMRQENRQPIYNISWETN